MGRQTSPTDTSCPFTRRMVEDPDHSGKMSATSAITVLLQDLSPTQGVIVSDGVTPGFRVRRSTHKMIRSRSVETVPDAVFGRLSLAARHDHREER